MSYYHQRQSYRANANPERWTGNNPGRSEDLLQEGHHPPPQSPWQGSDASPQTQSQPPYPTYRNDYAQPQYAQAQPQYPSQQSSSAPQHATYNPQAYAQQPSAPNSPPLRSPYAPSIPSSRQPVAYNPAHYQYQDNSIANAVDRMYGPLSGSSTASNYTSVPGTGSFASQDYSQPTSASVQSSYYGPRPLPPSTGSQRRQYGGSAPLPSQEFYASSYPPAMAIPAQPMSSPGYRTSPPARGRPFPSLQPAEESNHRPSTYSAPVPMDSSSEPNWSYTAASAPRDQVTGSRDRERNPPASHAPSYVEEGQQARPLPGLPIDLEPDNEYTHRSTNDDDVSRSYSDDLQEQDELFEEIENSFGNSPVGSGLLLGAGRSRTGRESIARQSSLSPAGVHSRSTSDASRRRYRASPTGSRRYGDNSDDSDAEAAAGLEAMRQAAEEEQSHDQRRRDSVGGFRYGYGGSSLHQSYPPLEEQYEPDSDDEADFSGVDMSTLGGGVDVPMSNTTDDPLELIAAHHNDPSGVRGQHPSTSSRGSVLQNIEEFPARSSSQTSMTAMSSYSPRPSHAYVDQAGTGGNAVPSLGTRKMSFGEDDEYSYYEQQTFGEGDVPSGPANLPYSNSFNRPLPPPPPQDSRRGTPKSISDQPWDHPSGYYHPADLDSAYQPHTSNSIVVPRSISLNSQPSGPKQQEPMNRAKTEIRQKPQRPVIQLVEPFGAMSEERPLATPAAYESIVLPNNMRFVPSRLSAKDFNACSEPWALSRIADWLRLLADGETELKEPPIFEALTLLFTNKVPNLNITIAETLAADVITELYQTQVLIHEEEWLRFGRGSVTGVLHQLTGKGCYAQSLHDVEAFGRCYSRTCQRTVRKLDLQSQSLRSGADWATFYSISKTDVENSIKRDVELQNNLHEVVTSEDLYMDNLNVLCTLYRDALKTANPPIISPKRLPDFLKDVFGRVDAVKAANEEHLLPQLKYRQQEQGPWITGVSDIFRHWIRKAKQAYIDYASNFPQANFLMKLEESRNSMFVTFVESARSNKLSSKLDWSSYLRTPITRLQRYSLLLGTVQKNTPPEATAEHANLQKALDEIKAVTMDCDARVAEMGKKTDMYDLQSRLVLRPEMKHVELNLTHLGREILHRGELQRTGGNRFTWVQTHAILLDNYLVLSKPVALKDPMNVAKFDVSKMPIPMDLLMLDSTNDDPMEKSYKGLNTVTTTTSKPVPPPELRSIRANSTYGNNSLTQINTNDSTSGKITPSTIVGDGNADGRILYPFKIKHLGRESYILYASSSADRKVWCDKIIEAKTRHASSLFSQNAEPFKLRVLADSAFAYDSPVSGSKVAMIDRTPLQRAIAEVERTYGGSGMPGPICRAKVNCAITFKPSSGRQMLAVGTDYGVYLAESGDVRGWTRAISALRVTQIAVIEEFNLFILISDKSLIAYHLDVVCPAGGPASAPPDSSGRKAPQKLSGSRDVSFFNIGRLKDRTLIFYKKGSMNSTFKIIEPVLHRVAEKSRTRGFLSRGTLESFREYDEFYIPLECTALEIFTTTLAAATSKGFEVLNLDKKTPFTVPDLKAPHVATIAKRLDGVTPLAMFRLSDLEFLCVYEECAVYVNKHSDISRSVVMEFVGRARAAALEAGYLVLFDDDFVEVRDAQTGRLKQVVPGREVRCLDDGRGNGAQQVSAGAQTNGGMYSAGVVSPQGGLGIQGQEGKRTVKFTLQHPVVERTQIVVELVHDPSRLG